jgi:aminoglycoside phosphotransferase (APT) family kinase protein
VIDWGDALIGDPACDFAGLLNDCGNNFTSLVFGSYTGATGSRFWQRVDFYCRIIPFYELLHAHRTNNPDLMQDGLVRVRNAFD